MATLRPPTISVSVQGELLPEVDYFSIEQRILEHLGQCFAEEPELPRVIPVVRKLRSE